MALKFVIMILVVVKSAHSAIDAGVTVFGTTEAPNFKRPEGRRKFRVDTHPYERECDFLSNYFQPPSHVPQVIPLHAKGERNAQVTCSNRTMPNQVGANCQPLKYSRYRLLLFISDILTNNPDLW